MRFLHTADWHVGKPLRNRNRDDEYRAALEEVLDIARRERVDCVLVAGDVYDASMPPPEAERMVYDFFVELRGHAIKAVVIAGNHDHPRRLNAVARVLEKLDVHVRGEVMDPDAACLVVAGRDGDAATVAALPWVPERRAVLFEEVAAPEVGQAYSQYAARMSNALGVCARRFRPDTVNVLMAHLFVNRALVGSGGGERPLHLTQTYAVEPQALPSTADYVALGHLHRPQAIDASPCRHTYYAGSLLQLDFGERDQGKRVLVFDAHPGRPPEVREITLSSGRRLREVTGTLEDLRARADSFGDDFLRVIVRTDAPVTALAARVREILPNALEVIPAPGDGPAPEEARAAVSLRSMTPLELLQRYYRSEYEADLPDDLGKLFMELSERQAEEERER